MTRWYCAIVHKDGGSAFGVTFPDLPGCFSAADCEADIVPNAMEALALWFADRPEEEAITLSGITHLAEEPIAAGAFVIRVPWDGGG